ncbi:hypothetical protein RG089_000600 [Elizabethkingia anophelis]|uniref:hypothetical protein n=1 Tax=Elizabethkingia miricola TaxID=172045 RepID=UPI00280C67DB|nr:hypothetical protein [Elizabethkingia anophelis]ELB1892032.1 hypothetical protein [Elizabethkingia anophelis]
MGVDYSANKGIGFMINHRELEGDEDFDIRDYLDKILTDTGYRYFAVGDEGYSGDPDEFYVVLEFFKPIQNLQKRAQKLKEFLLALHLISEDAECDLVGGLEIY